MPLDLIIVQIIKKLKSYKIKSQISIADDSINICNFLPSMTRLWFKYRDIFYTSMIKAAFNEGIIISMLCIIKSNDIYGYVDLILHQIFK